MKDILNQRDSFEAVRRIELLRNMQPDLPLLEEGHPTEAAQEEYARQLVETASFSTFSNSIMTVMIDMCKKSVQALATKIGYTLRSPRGTGWCFTSAMAKSFDTTWIASVGDTGEFEIIPAYMETLASKFVRAHPEFQKKDIMMKQVYSATVGGLSTNARSYLSGDWQCFCAHEMRRQILIICVGQDSHLLFGVEGLPITVLFLALSHYSLLDIPADQVKLVDAKTIDVGGTELIFHRPDPTQGTYSLPR
jgi:hypothetical protein